MELAKIFDFHHYRDFVEAHIQSCPQGKHGEKSRISKAIRCHNAYLSQVLSGKAELSMEQAHDLSSYLNLSQEETEYLLLLVQHARAGTQTLQKYYRDKIKGIEEKRMRFENRIQVAHQISKEDQSVYFSAWFYSVIHLMITTLPGFNNVGALEKALSLPSSIIKEVLQFLEEAKLIHREAGQYRSGAVDIFLGANSTMLRAHQTHWRLQAIRSVEKKNKENLHYSAVVTINQQDFLTIRKSILRFLEEKRKRVADSKDEDTVACINLDWFLVSN